MRKRNHITEFESERAIYIDFEAILSSRSQFYKPYAMLCYVLLADPRQF